MPQVKASALPPDFKSQEDAAAPGNFRMNQKIGVILGSWLDIFAFNSMSGWSTLLNENVEFESSPGKKL